MSELGTLSVEQLNQAVNLLKAKPAVKVKNVKTAPPSIAPSFPASVTDTPASNGQSPIVLSVTNRQPVLSGASNTVPAQQTVMSTGNCITVPIDKPIIIGQPVQHVQQAMSSMPTVISLASQPSKSIQLHTASSSQIVAPLISNLEGFQSSAGNMVLSSSCLPQSSSVVISSLPKSSTGNATNVFSSLTSQPPNPANIIISNTCLPQNSAANVVLSQNSATNVVMPQNAVSNVVMAQSSAANVVLSQNSATNVVSNVVLSQSSNTNVLLPQTSNTRANMTLPQSSANLVVPQQPAASVIIANDGTLQLSNPTGLVQTTTHLPASNTVTNDTLTRLLSSLAGQGQATYVLPSTSQALTSMPVVLNNQVQPTTKPVIVNVELLPEASSANLGTSISSVPPLNLLLSIPPSSTSVTSASATPVASISGSQAPVVLKPTMVLKKTERQTSNGTVLEMVEKMQPASKTEDQQDDLYKEYQNIDLYGMANGFYCVECDINHQMAACELHSWGIKDVKDSPVISLAVMSIPAQLQLLQGASKATLPGLATRVKIAKQTRFGPLVGELRDAADVEIKEDLPMVWKVYDVGEQRCRQVYDCSDDKRSNWMSLVRRARNNEEQNLVAYQQGLQIWFITCADIPPNTELHYWYSSDYAKCLGMPLKPSNWFKCAFCHKTFLELHKVQSHIAYNHPSSTPNKYKCKMCLKSFSGKVKLNTHELTHLGVKPHVCDTCGKQFSDQSNLRLHKHIHTGEKRFSCQQCGKAFRQKAHLVAHFLVHSGEKKLPCSYCDRHFARQSDLRNHERTVHLPTSAYPCTHPGCSKVFHKLSLLTKHSLTHSNTRNFSCTACSKAFLTKYHLRRHVKTCKGELKGKMLKDYPATVKNSEHPQDSSEI